MRISGFSVAMLLVSSSLFISSCSRNYIALDYTNAKGEVPRLGNLVFRFNKPLYPDSLINTWDSSGYISFEPSIPGRFRWNGPDELVFSPAQPLLPATNYKAKVQNEVLRFSKYNDIRDGDEINFNTAPLQLNDAQVTWVVPDESQRQALPQVNIQFNYPVQVDDLKDKLKVSVDGKDILYVFQTIGVSDLVTVRLNGFKGEDRNYEAKIVVDKGLRPDKGSIGSESPMNASLSIPSPYVLNINNVESEFDGSEGVIHIYASQQLNGEQVSKYISFEPAVKYSVEFEDYGLTIRSTQFDASSSYAMTINSGLRGRIGGVLKEPYDASIAFGKLEPDIDFPNDKAVYLSKKGSGNIEVRIASTSKVKLIISKIYENNLLMAERYGYYPSDPEEDNADGASSYEDYNDYSNSMAGDVIYSKEIDTRSLPREGNSRILNIAQFEDRLPDAKGIYHVLIRSSENYWVRDSRFISFSDIGLIARQSRDKMYVFANSIQSAAGLPGVTINVYGANNQLLGTGATNAEGAAEVKLVSRNFSGFRPAMVIAKTADDFTYLPFGSTKVNTSRFDVGGKRNNPAGLDAFVYAERDIYRPGETVNFSFLLRDSKWKSPGELPVKVRFLLPNGKELKSFRKTLNDQGAAEGSIEIASSAITGSYTLELYTSNDVLLATKNFMIEEFVPDRIRVTAKLDKPYLKPGQDATLSLNAVNFFGPPAINRDYETEIQLKQKMFAPKNFPGYDFSLDNQRSFFDKDVRQGKTDASGNATEVFEVPAMYANTGLLQASFYSTVFDETGRPVSRNVSSDIYTQDVFHGVKDDGYYYYALNSPVRFQLVSVNREGNAVNATAKVQVIKHEYRTVLAKNGSYFRYESQQDDKVMNEQQISIGSNTVYSYVPRSPGSYELRIFRPEANAYVSRKFYSYGSWGNNSSFEVNTEGNIAIDLEKESYNAGETAKIFFKTPFSGKMLVTVETDHLISYRYLQVDKRTAEMELPLEGEHVPNIYITATLIKPHGISDIPLTVAHGFQNIMVSERNRKIPVVITARQSVRSKTRQQVTVKAIPGSYVTLAAVDNGVLQITDFQTPDPYGFYYQKKALEVNGYDLYPLLFPELRTRLSSTGGDGDLDMNKRVNPMPARRFKIMSYWSGIKKTDGNGEASFEYDIPQFSGQVRLMAVAFKDERFGSAEATTTVADPLVLSSGLPRFISPGDSVLLPLTINNTTGSTASGEASIQVIGPLQVAGPAAKSVRINGNSEERVPFTIVAGNGIGVAKVRIQVSALGENFTEETEISVRPPSTLQKISGSGSIAGGASQTISIPSNDFIPGSFQYELVVGRSPMVELTKQLRYLVQYPYGCTEQTVSSAFPQLYFADMAELAGLKDGRQNANANVIEAIRKIKMRQLYTGAVTLWDDEGTENWWATIYAAHFLIEAKKAGFDVDNSMLQTMLSYIAGRLKNRETVEYYYNRVQHRKIAPKEVAYALYVLALGGRAQVPAMNYYKANPQILALDSKYLLSAAYAVSGDRRSYASMLPTSFSGEESEQQTGGSFYSYLRDESIALNSLMDVDPGNAQIPLMARHVSNLLKSEKYINTQEAAFSFLALGKIARTAAKGNVKAEIRSRGKTVARVSDQWKGNSAQLGTAPLEITTSGSGRLYYCWIAEGISSTGAYNEEDNFIRVGRKFFDRYGKQITGNTFKQNDLVIVELTLDRLYNTRIENIVLTDLLPAGFEIENPRTKEIPGMDWIKGASEPEALDVRDDRIHFFVNANIARQRYYYAVRAVSLGQYRQGPVSADAMYAGEIHSYHGVQTIRVVNE